MRGPSERSERDEPERKRCDCSFDSLQHGCSSSCYKISAIAPLLLVRLDPRQTRLEPPHDLVLAEDGDDVDDACSHL